MTNFREYSYQVALVLSQQRARKGITQRQLSKAIGLPNSVISYYESGNANPTLKNLVILAEFFGIRVAEFLLSRRRSFRIVSSSEFKNESGLIPGVVFKDLNLSEGSCIDQEVHLLRQLTIKVIVGKVLVKMDYLERTQIVAAGETLLIPGGGIVTIVGITESGARVQIFESERTEVRGLEV